MKHECETMVAPSTGDITSGLKPSLAIEIFISPYCKVENGLKLSFGAC
jgi:hypothetical protein